MKYVQIDILNKKLAKIQDGWNIVHIDRPGPDRVYGVLWIFADLAAMRLPDGMRKKRKTAGQET